MNWNNVKLVLFREVRDQLRDRRTLFMILVLPLLLYPVLGIGMVQMTLLFSEQERTVVLLGADELPDPPLIVDGRFVPSYFERPDDADKLRVITDAASSPASDADLTSQELSERQELIDAARLLQEQIARLLPIEDTLTAAYERAGQLDTDRTAAREKHDAVQVRQIESNLSGVQAEIARLETQVGVLKTELGDALATTGIEVLILVPQGFKEAIVRINEMLTDRSTGFGEIPPPPRVRIIRNSANEKSLIAYQRVKEAVSNWEEALLADRLTAAQLPESLPRPVNADAIDVAQESQLSANIWSKLFPAMLVLMGLTGAFYPAIDLGAGEKERGTMETLLISPATRTEIVIGKFLTVLIFSLGTAILNLVSMGFTGQHILSIAGAGQMSKFGGVTFPPVSSLLWMVLLAIPLAALFSSLSLGLAMFARSSKEGQYYLTPLLTVTMGITVFCLSPAIEITPFYSVFPVMGPALLLKARLLGPPASTSLYWYAIPVLVTSIGYSVLGLWWAVEQFKREDILFREAERFELKLWIKHLLRDKDPVPGFSEAGICFAAIMLLQFFAMRVLGTAMVGVEADQLPRVMMRLLLIQQVAIIATPALLMGVLLTTSLRDTFRLRWPRWSMLAAAVVLPFVLHPLTIELSIALQDFFPKLPESAQAALAPMLDPSQPLWLVLLTFAVAPAICEELAFRGFILSGFASHGRITLAIVVSAVAFGAMHMFPQQAFNAALLGLVLGLLAIRSGSLLPGVIFHFFYNGIEVVRNRLSPEFWSHPLVNWAVRTETVHGEAANRYTWPLLLVCGVVAALVLTWLVQQDEKSRFMPVELTSEHRSLPTPSPG